MLRTPIAVALAALAASTALSACAPVKMGAAAVIGDDRITTAELDGDVADLRDAAAAEPSLRSAVVQLDRSSPGEITRITLTNLILLRVADQAAQDAGITVSSGQVDARIREIGGAEEARRQLLGRAIPPARLRDWARLLVIEDELARRAGVTDPQQQGQQYQQAIAEAIIGTARRMDIRVNPRFGSFDVSQFSIAPAAGRLSKPASPSPAPSPGGPGG